METSPGGVNRNRISVTSGGEWICDGSMQAMGYFHGNVLRGTMLAGNALGSPIMASAVSFGGKADGQTTESLNANSNFFLFSFTSAGFLRFFATKACRFFLFVVSRFCRMSCFMTAD